MTATPEYENDIPDDDYELVMREQALRDLYRSLTRKDDAHRVDYVPLVEAVVRAVFDTGPTPQHHRRIMKRHRTEWPALWAALDALVAQRLNEDLAQRVGKDSR